MKSFGKIIFLLMPLLLLPSCVQEVWPDGGMTEGIVIPFGAPVATDVVVSTKGTLTDPKLENCIYNMYVFVFKSGETDAEKEKIFGYFFDERNLNLGAGDYWTVTNNDPSEGGKTHGTIHLKTLKESGCTIVAICNIDSEMVNISPESLGLVGNYAQLKELEATLNQQILSRNGYFPMCGEITGADFSSGAYVRDPMQPMKLERLDAKIKFNVLVNNTKDKILNFTPMSWQVINVPKSSYVLPQNTDAANTASQFFNGKELVFETMTLPTNNDSDPFKEYYDKKYTGKTASTQGSKIPVHGFSFYMMENRKAPTTTPKDESGADATWTYKIRELQNKDASGKLTGGFKNANSLATYVILKGRLELKEESSSKIADVQYVIHLGNFTANPGDFNVERNHTYTYNIFIKDVEDIRIEVQGDEQGEKKEKEPGATGDILISEGGAITCDSHYSTHSLVFYKNDIVPDKMNWWVLTPFNPDGADPREVNLSGIDYKWVEFRVNVDRKEAGKYKLKTWTSYQPHGSARVTRDMYKYVVDPSLSDNPYQTPTATPEPYSPTMYIDELIDFLAVATGKVSGVTLDTDVFDGDSKVVITAFVNEYYYEKDPISGQYVPDLWKRFVNQPMRTMCILSDVVASTDGESHVINSSFTIQQHSIQSVYNINNPDLNSGWGGEYLNDVRESLCKQYWKNRGNDQRHNDNHDNGRWDTMIEWGLRTSDNPTYLGNSMQWATYLNLTDDDDEKSLMNTNSSGESYAYLRYSCMSRNRDNDGDGYIDKDEVRWYMAASNQLLSLSVGAYGIEGEARLYQRTPEQKYVPSGDKDIWRQHVLGSDCVNYSSNSNDAVRIVWAEDGMSGSSMSYPSFNWDQTTFFSIRCVRNLGYDPNGDSTLGKDITFSDENTMPAPLLKVTRHKLGQSGATTGWDNNTYFEVDCSNLNEKSIRYYTSGELPPHDENDEASCLYKKFRTIANNERLPARPSVDIVAFNQNIDNNSVQYCPEGFHVPNCRELLVMFYFMEGAYGNLFGDNNNNTFARTTFSLGSASTVKVQENIHWGWAARNTKIQMAGNSSGNTYKTTSPRCVKDVKVD